MEYTPPEMADNDDARSKKSTYKARHVSLQSRVDSIAAESMYSGSSSMPELPDRYRHFASTSYILDPHQSRSWEPQGIAVPPNPPPPVIGSQHPVEMSNVREVFFVLTIAVAHVVTQAALGQALAPIDIIARSFHTSNPGQMSWFIAGYSLTVGTFILISGRLGDILGHKRVFVFGYAWLGMWSCFAGFSVYPGTQVFFGLCRGMQGIGPALLMPNGLALFGRAYSPGIKKNIVFSVFGALGPMGFVIGATFGSLFAQLLWWPWAFWSFGAACFFLSIFAIFIIPPSLSQRPSRHQRPSFDYAGSLTGVAGLVLVNTAWNNGPLYGWGTPHVYFVLIIGIICLIGFGWVEARASNPLLPTHALNSTVLFVLACTAAGWASFGIWIFYSFRFLSVLRHSLPLSVSAQFAPCVVAGLCACVITGALLTHSPVSFVMFVSTLAFCLGSCLAGTMRVQQSYWAQTFISAVVMPFGMDMSFPAATVLLSNHMPREHQGLAASLVNTVVNYSISIALGLAGTVETGIVGRGQLSDAQTEWGMRCAFYTGIALSVLGVLLGAAFFLKTMVKEGWRVMDH